jgi:hypothetical protein
LKASCEDGEHASDLARAGGQFKACDSWIPQRSCGGRAMQPRQAAILYSLVESARLAGVEPAAYLRAALLAAIAEQPIPLPHEIAAGQN